MATLLHIQDLGKQFWRGQSPPKGARHLINDLFTRPTQLFAPLQRQAFWALQDINFQLEEGQKLGIIGRNGAGKSTLLKLIGRVLAPTTGQITLRGRVGSLLEVGTGFHPELTGRENIYLNAALLGMKRHEVNLSFSSIVDFSEIGDFLDTPVKHYSSGMYVRLAFAVAAHLPTEILIVDEVLAVGDSSFQKKCIDKMNEIGRQGRAILFVSHHLSLVQALCSHGLLLSGGQQAAWGPISHIAAQYETSLRHTPAPRLGQRSALGASYIDDAQLILSGAQALPGDTISLKVQAQLAPSHRQELQLVAHITTPQGFRIASLASPPGPLAAADSAWSVACHCCLPALRPGSYFIHLQLYCRDTLLDEAPAALTLEVAQKLEVSRGYLTPADHGPLQLPSRWEAT